MQQLLVESVVDYGMFVLDAEGRVASWNSGAEKLKGYAPADILGRHFSVFYPPEAVAAAWPQKELEQARAQGRFEDEGWRVRKDGTRFWANVVITALFEPPGHLVGYAKVTRDLTERRRNEEALRLSEQRFRLLVDSVRDYAMFMLDPAGQVRSWNAGAESLTGYAGHEVMGRHFGLFFTGEDRAAGQPQAELQRALLQVSTSEEGWRVRRDGSLFRASVTLSAMRDPSGELIGYAKIVRDMSERRRLEELERSSRRMNEFLAMLAHELRNPLAPIRNSVTIMQLEPITSPVLRNCRDVIDRQLTHVTRLVDDLLDVGRLTTGKIKLRKELVRVSDVMQRAVETVRPLLQARRHQIEVDLPAQPVYVAGDSTRLAQVLQNLLVNAARYTPDGGEVVLRLQAEEAAAIVSVSDNGRGIEPENLERIFELFMQADAAGSGAESGLGIGLTLARSLVELHGGVLTAASPGLGQGSTFTVRLPRADPAGPEDTPAAPGQVSGLRILVVDDNRDSADSATDILRLLGHEVDCVYEGASAVRRALAFRPDVVMLDLAMPGIDGFETRRLLRAQPGLGRTFLIAMTGFGNEDDKRRTRAAGFDAHLTKPVELDALIALLNEARERVGQGGPSPG